VIFVTVGSQTPFDRLARTVDACAARIKGEEVLAQIGNGEYKPVHMRWVRDLNPEEFRKACADCRVIVSHAGIGTILLAREFEKPLVILPRRADLRETRNDHQLAAVAWLRTMPGLAIAADDADLARILLDTDRLEKPLRIGPWAGDALLTTVRHFINGD
jgi:UDP-N-acetylglucosamine transferase subunit ALG13